MVRLHFSRLGKTGQEQTRQPVRTRGIIFVSSILETLLSCKHTWYLITVVPGLFCSWPVFPSLLKCSLTIASVDYTILLALKSCPVTISVSDIYTLWGDSCFLSRLAGVNPRHCLLWLHPFPIPPPAPLPVSAIHTGDHLLFSLFQTRTCSFEAILRKSYA